MYLVRALSSDITAQTITVSKFHPMGFIDRYINSTNIELNETEDESSLSSAKSTLAMAKVAPENSPRSRVRFCGAFAGLCGRARKLTPALVIKFFKELDEDVVDNLADGSIRLVSADYLRSGEMKHVDDDRTLKPRKNAQVHQRYFSLLARPNDCGTAMLARLGS